MTGELAAALDRAGRDIDDSPVDAEALGSLLDMGRGERVVAADGETGVRDHVRHRAATPREIVEAEGLRQLSDTSAIEAEVDRVLAAHPRQAAAWRGGKTKLLGFFVGQTMKATGGKADPGAVNEALRRKLENAAE